MKPKLIYLTARHPELSRSAFVHRWRQHAALGMSRPRWINIERYVHCDVLTPPTPLPDVSNIYDGVGMIWHRSTTHRSTHLADTTSKVEMEADDAATFARPINECCLLAEEHEIFSFSGAAVSTIKLFRFARLADDTPMSALHHLVMTARTAVAQNSTRPLRHRVNLPIDPQTEGRAKWGLPCSVVEEFWFEDQDHLREFYNAFIRGSALPGESNAITIVTNEVVLHDRPEA